MMNQKEVKKIVILDSKHLLKNQIYVIIAMHTYLLKAL